MRGFCKKYSLLIALFFVSMRSMDDSSPKLFCSDEPGEWCLIDSKEPAFRLIDNLLEHAKEMKKKAPEAQAAYEKQKNVTCVLMRRASPYFCREVAESLNHNFQGTGIDPKQVYEFIDISFNRGKYMLHDQMLSHLAKLLVTKKITEKQHRQLQYVFKTVESKEEYDAFYTGSLELLMVDEKKAESFIEQYGQIIRYGINLAEVSRVAQQFDQIEPLFCDQGDDRLWQNGEHSLLKK